MQAQLHIFYKRREITFIKKSFDFAYAPALSSRQSPFLLASPFCLIFICWQQNGGTLKIVPLFYCSIHTDKCTDRWNVTVQCKHNQIIRFLDFVLTRCFECGLFSVQQHCCEMREERPQEGQGSPGNDYIYSDILI